MKKEAKLISNAEPLQVVYPEGYIGEKSGSIDDEEFFISTVPKLLTEGEIALVKEMLTLLPYRQTLAMTGCVMGVASEIVPFMSNAELDIYEQQKGMPSSSVAPNGGRRTVRERKLLITERIG